MASVQVKLNHSGMNRLLHSAGVQSMLRQYADSLRRALGAGYASGVDVRPEDSRSRGYVVTASYDAMRDNSRNHTLLRALSGHRR